MKQLLVFLLIVNGMFFAYEQYVRPGMETLPTEADGAPQLDNIVLVKELPSAPQVQVSEPLSTVNPSDSHKATPNQPTTAFNKPDAPLLMAEPSVLKTFSLPQEPAKPLLPNQPTIPAVAAVEPAATLAKPAPTPQPTPVTSAKPVAVDAPPAAPAVSAAEPSPAPAAIAKPAVSEPSPTPAVTAKPAAPEPEPAHPAVAASKPTASAAPAPAVANKPQPDKPAGNAQSNAVQEKTASNLCRRIGPLNSEADAQALKQQLAAVASKISVEHKPGKGEELGYWVLYPASTSLATARANKQLLEQKGFTATTIINSDHEYAVSLGFFKERANASKLQGDARLKGLGIIVKPRTDQREEYWLKLQVKSLAAMANPWRNWQTAHPSAHDSPCP